MRARVLPWLAISSSLAGCLGGPALQVLPDPDLERLTVRIEGREAFSYQYGRRFATPHLFPIRSPTGRPLTVQKAEPYPHHRSLWIADRIQLEDGPVVDFYHSHKNLKNPRLPGLGYASYIRHDAITDVAVDGDQAGFSAKLTWLIAGQGPALDDARRFRVRNLGNGEYWIDLSWRLTASYGKLTFRSDWVHYAWPYLRMDPRFSGEFGGRIVDDLGRAGQNATNGHVARWIDYSNRVDGVTEGLTVFLYPDGHAHKWLTREYGTFGPRRPDPQSGTGFTLARGESLSGRVGILVHRGDVKTGQVAERYLQYAGAN